MKSIRGLLRKRMEEPKMVYPAFLLKEPRQLVVLPAFKDITKVDVKYPLLEPMVYVGIKWDPKEKKIIYNIMEPQLDPDEEKTLKSIETALTEMIDVKMSVIKNREEIVTYLEKKVTGILKDMRISLTADKYMKIMYFITRNFAGLNEIEALMFDPYIEDIGCTGAGTRIYVIHRKFGSIETNIIYNDMEYLTNFVIKLSERCGRYISYASPLLDGSLPDGSRVQASLAKDVTTKGPTFSIRKFRKNPYSAIDLINTKTTSAAMMAYMWFLIEHGVSILICGGVSTGKTTLLNVLSMFISPEDKIVSIEDSVDGNSELMVRRDGLIYRKKIEDAFNELKKGSNHIAKNENLEILTIDDMYKLHWTKPTSFSRHKINKDMFEITTSTGRRITVTGDHSLFGLAEGELREVKPLDLKDKEFVAVPRQLPISVKGIKEINLLNHLDAFKDDFLEGEKIKKKLSRLAYKDLEKHISYSMFSKWKRKGVIKIDVLMELIEKDKIKLSPNRTGGLVLRNKSNHRLPLRIKIDSKFSEFLGLWIGDGSYDNFNKNRVIISNCDGECISLCKNIAGRFGINITLMSDSVSMSLNSTLFYKLLKYVFRLDGYASTKRIPDIIFNLSDYHVKAFLSGYFSADGTVKKHEVCCCSQSYPLLQDIQTLLLRFGIISRIGSLRQADKCYEMGISSSKNLTPFREIGFLQDRKNKRLSSIYKSAVWHDHSDVIPLDTKLISNITKIQRLSFPYTHGMQNIGRDYLCDISEDDPSDMLNKLAHSDIFWDKVRNIRKLKRKERWVYDASIPSYERFICSNFLAHNTREINLSHDNWIPSVSRTGFGVPESSGRRYGEITLFDLLKESFRMNPDYVIVGEVRGKEAYVMFQGISSGHPSIGTIHAGSIEDVIKRLETPPIELSPSLIESLDVLIVMVNAQEKGKSARRVKEVVEVQSVDARTGNAHTIKIFGWIPSKDIFKDNVPNSEVLRRISFERGLSYQAIVKELERRKGVLEWMQRHDISYFADVANTINLYYKDPDTVIKWIETNTYPDAEKIKKAVEERITSSTGLKVIGE